MAHQAAAARTDLDPKPSSLRPIDSTCLSQDEALQGIPTQFVKDVLRDLGELYSPGEGGQERELIIHLFSRESQLLGFWQVSTALV